MQGINHLSKAWPHIQYINEKNKYLLYRQFALVATLKEDTNQISRMQILFAYTKQMLKMTAFLLSFGVYCAVL